MYKKLVKLCLVATLCIDPLCHAVAVTANTTTMYAQLGPLSLPVPWDMMNAVYLYDVPQHLSEVGGEMVFAQLKIGSYKSNPVELNLTGGGVIVPNSTAIGTGFAGMDLILPNIIPMFSQLDVIQPGLFGGYAINHHMWVFGLKAAINVFNGPGY
jgi:hypothetical protein